MVTFINAASQKADEIVEIKLAVGVCEIAGTKYTAECRRHGYAEVPAEEAGNKLVFIRVQ
ncbi:MAG TPA: hypothetical protein VIW07_10325 [Candidatus Udaeobacter sp.]